MNELENFRWQLRYYRWKAKLSQEALAAAAGVDKKTLTNVEFEGSQLVPLLSTAWKLARVLGVGLAELDAPVTDEQRREFRKWQEEKTRAHANAVR